MAREVPKPPRAGSDRYATLAQETVRRCAAHRAPASLTPGPLQAGLEGALTRAHELAAQAHTARQEAKRCACNLLGPCVHSALPR